GRGATCCATARPAPRRGPAGSATGTPRRCATSRWGRADQLVWLDYERPLIMVRVVRRSVWRALTRKPMWNDNREDWRTWANPEHPIPWAGVKHGERRRQEPPLLPHPEDPPLQ